MTEELKAEIDEYVRDTCVYYRSTHEDMLPNQFEKYLRKACIHFATKNGIQWHDLRKDPNDLPKCNNTDLLLCIESKKFKNNFYSLFSRIEQPPKEEQMKRFMITCNVIAWCEIPQFKE